MSCAFIEAGLLKSRIRNWVLQSFPVDDYDRKVTVLDRVLQIGDAGKYRLVHPSWLPRIIANDPRANPSLYTENQYDCEDLAFAARVAVSHCLLTQPTVDGYRLPPAFGFIATELHVLNLGVSTDETPYLFDVRTQKTFAKPTLEGSFLDGTVASGWLNSVERIRYAFV